MAKTYTYDPTNIMEESIDRMRFELGDTETEGGADTCALCDEEYQAMLNKAKKDGKGWKWATFLCVKAIKMKFSFETDSSVSGVSFSLSNRFKVWDELHLRLQKSFQVPRVNPKALGEGMPDGGHYFNLGQGNNPAVDAVPPGPWRL